jgi:hypothetical protein
LQKSAIADGRPAISLGATGVEPPAPTDSTHSYTTQYTAHARVAVARPAMPAAESLGDGSQNKLILGALWATKRKPTKPQDALQVRKPHLNLLAPCRDVSKPSVPESDRAMSRACS